MGKKKVQCCQAGHFSVKIVDPELLVLKMKVKLKQIIKLGVLSRYDLEDT